MHLTCIRAVERVRQISLHPGNNRQNNIRWVTLLANPPYVNWTPAFAGVTESLYHLANLGWVKPHSGDTQQNNISVGFASLYPPYMNSNV